MMTVQAQNALLKTLEEPPEYAIIFLLTENADNLLATIRSRCVMLKLRHIKDKLVKKYLMEELKKFPQIKEVRGQGLMIGMEFEEPIKDIRRNLLFEKKVFTGVSGTNVIRLLPPLCLSMEEAEEFLKRFKEVL